ncbi:hypothetical protein JHL22_04135 [Advenella sp. WQ 585]|uniref:FAD/NAD(P)-binding domain-containing protein n=1 Tax=Advenella mandrilli TaxID=2800330 RepID=A0ABS1EBZ9_9BURK|nr:hypothetical protein [Advenella mandrilli]MBK1780398.1 hypothetical protein [Advenella mandrilli]NLY34621.1 hypothetical protein [Alcaligenaceae bacterium]
MKTQDHKVVIVGGGAGGLELAAKLGRNVWPGDTSGRHSSDYLDLVQGSWQIQNQFWHECQQ